jgi:hypothetical protein
MLHRLPSPDALRARKSRARLKAGVRTFRVRAHHRRLVAALRKANPQAGELDAWPEVEAELAAIVEEFITRWVGGKNPFA